MGHASASLEMRADIHGADYAGRDERICGRGVEARLVQDPCLAFGFWLAEVVYHAVAPRVRYLDTQFVRSPAHETVQPAAVWLAPERPHRLVVDKHLCNGFNAAQIKRRRCRKRRTSSFQAEHLPTTFELSFLQT